MIYVPYREKGSHAGRSYEAFINLNALCLDQEKGDDHCKRAFRIEIGIQQQAAIRTFQASVVSWSKSAKEVYSLSSQASIHVLLAPCRGRDSKYDARPKEVLSSLFLLHDAGLEGAKHAGWPFSQP